MAKCIECAWFPWVPGADFSNLPAQRCHPSLKMRTWTNNSVNVEHSCPYFKSRNSGDDNKADKNIVDVREMTVKQLKQYLQTVEDKEALQTLKAQEESADSPRVTAIEVIEARIRGLEEGDA